MYSTLKDKQITDIYDQLLQTLKQQVEPKLFDSIFDSESFELKTIQGNRATFVCDNESTATIINSAYASDIQTILADALETPIDVEILTKAAYLKKKEAIESSNAIFFKTSSLDSQMTFDTFVVGDSNKSAHAASLLAVNSPAASNPIFIYSASGLGKTHLLNAIGNEYSLKNPDAKVLYITSDDFLNEAVKYLKGRSAEELRDFFTTVDMLLVDDVQFLAGKTETQNMFFSIFNSLTAAKKQIVLTSDREPSELKEFPERLTSRFKGGLTISIGSPNKDTLTKILRMKVQINGYKEDNFTDEALEYLANNYSKNVRELNGAFTNLLFAVTTAPVVPKMIDLDFVKSVFHRDEEKKKIKGKANIDQLIKVVADQFNLTESQLRSKCRISQIAYARQIAMYLARDVLGMTYQNIGRSFEKDHSTVMTNITKIANDMEKDLNLKETIHSLEEKLSAD